MNAIRLTVLALNNNDCPFLRVFFNAIVEILVGVSDGLEVRRRRYGSRRRRSGLVHTLLTQDRKE